MLQMFKHRHHKCLSRCCCEILLDSIMNSVTIWIFSDSQAAIQRLQNSSLKAEQKYISAIENWIIKIKAK